MAQNNSQWHQKTVSYNYTNKTDNTFKKHRKIRDATGRKAHIKDVSKAHTLKKNKTKTGGALDQIQAANVSVNQVSSEAAVHLFCTLTHFS